MIVVIFCHSVRSDWNHGNAHFLRGVACDLQARGHTVRVFEPRASWSAANLERDAGAEALEAYRAVYPRLVPTVYDPATLDLDEALAGADLVLVHEWNEHELVARIGAHRSRRGAYRLLFHDTHHRSVSDPEAMAAYDLRHYDGVLAFGAVVRDRYLSNGWANRAWTWHEAADVRVFRPLGNRTREGDVVWIGNWGDGERTEELEEFLIEPVARLKLRARVYGVRYPAGALERLDRAGIEYGGWLPNYLVPDVFSRFAVTVHVPRRPYVRALPGVPTIRPFEALACGIPLVTAPWPDSEGLFAPGRDFLVARDGGEMIDCLRRVLEDPELAADLSAQGRRTILSRHTCAHRVDELLAILSGSRMPDRTSGVQRVRPSASPVRHSALGIRH